MKYQKRGGAGGAWLEKTVMLNGKRAKLVSETVPQEGGFGTQDVAKIRVEGVEGVFNVSVNTPSINALVDAFGDDSKAWVNQTLTLHAEKMIVSGKRVVGLYLCPAGYEVGEDEGGYLVVRKIRAKTAQLSTSTFAGKVYQNGEVPPEQVPDIEPSDIHF